jgi:hypothetical protein
MSDITDKVKDAVHDVINDVKDAARGDEATPALDVSAGVSVGMTRHLHLTQFRC